MKTTIIRASIILALLLSFQSVKLIADTHTWTGTAGDGSWSNASNWDIGVPSNFDDVIFNNGDTVTVININTRPNNLTISGNSLITLGYRMAIYGNLTVSSGELNFNNQRFSIGGSILINGGTLKLGNVTMTLSNGLVLSSGKLYLESSYLTMDMSDFEVSGGTLYPGSSTIEFQGDFSVSVTANQNISLNRLIINVDDFFGSFGLSGQESTVFTIEDYLQITNYDDFETDALSISGGSISYNNGAELRYNRALGVPVTGDEWPTSGLKKVVLMQGSVQLSESKTAVDTVVVQNGSLTGTISYSSNSLLYYSPPSVTSITIGDEWPLLNGPSSVTIYNPGSSVVGSQDLSLAHSLTVESGTLNLNNNALTVKGSMSGSTISGSGTIADGTTLILGNGGSTNYEQFISGSIQFDDIQINKSNGSDATDTTVTFLNALNLQVGANISVNRGVVDFNGKSLSLGGNNILSVLTTIKTGGTSILSFDSLNVESGEIQFTGSSVETMPSGILVDKLTINNSGGVVTSSGVLKVGTQLNLSNGLITTSETASLRLLTDATVTGTPDANKMVIGPLQKVFNQTGSFDYPVGKSSLYRPAAFEYISASAFAQESIISVEYSTSSFDQGTFPAGVSAIATAGHYVMKEHGTTPDTINYSFTAMFEDQNFLPENRNRILIQNSLTPEWEVGESEPTIDIDTLANTVTMHNATQLPAHDGMLVLAKGSSLLYFIAAASNNWFDSANWSTGSLPSSVDDIVIDSSKTLIIGDNDANALTETPLQSIASLTISNGSSLQISSANTATTALKIGTGSGSDTVLVISSTASLIIEGGSVKTVSIASGGSESMLVEGSVELRSGSGFGSGTGGLALPISRQIWENNSTLVYNVASQYFQAQTYGNLSLDLVDDMVLNSTMTVNGDMTFLSGDFAFVEGAVTGLVLQVEGNLNARNTAIVRTCLMNNGQNTFKVKGNIDVDSTASFYSDFSAILELNGNGVQEISSTIQSLRKLKLSGSGTKSITQDLVVYDSLIFDGGILNTGEHILTIGNSADQIGKIVWLPEKPVQGKRRLSSFTNNGNGGVKGKLKRWVPNRDSDTLYFPIYQNDILREAMIVFTVAPSAGILRVEYFPDEPGTTGLPLMDSDGTTVKFVYPSGFWRITPLNGLSGGTYEIELRTSDYTGISDPSTIRIIKRVDDTQPWSLLGSHSNGSTVGDDIKAKRTNLSGFSDFTFGGGDDNPLPVELSNFTISVKNDYPELSWTTLTERENYGFTIHKAYLGNIEQKRNDTLWTEAGFIHGQGTTVQKSEYTFHDTDIAEAGIYLYRLVQIDFDGSKKMYDPAEFKLEKPNFTAINSVYPNPFNPTTNISIDIAKQGLVELALYDLLGRKVSVLTNKPMQPGRYTFKLDGRNLSSGIYFVVMQTDGLQKVQKVTLLK